MTYDIQSEVEELNGQIEQLDDPRESYALVHQTIERHRAAGDEIHEDLHRLEKALQVECLCESQGR